MNPPTREARHQAAITTPRSPIRPNARIDALRAISVPERVNTAAQVATRAVTTTGVSQLVPSPGPGRSGTVGPAGSTGTVAGLSQTRAIPAATRQAPMSSIAVDEPSRVTATTPRAGPIE